MTTLWRTRLLGCLISLVMMAGCASEGPPAGILSQQQMIGVIADLQLAAAMAKDDYVQEDLVKIFFTKNAALIYQAYGTDHATFKKSYLYYMAHAQKLNEIYKAVIDSLSLQVQSVQNE